MPANPSPMRPLNALLLDESAADRAVLRNMLLRHPAISIQGEADSPSSIDAAAPLDVIFTDSDFRAGSLAEICPALPSGAELVIISADRGFAYQAFELDAADFLAKPLEPKRLAEAVRRLLRLDWRPDVPATAQPPEMVIIPFERGRRGVALRDICAIQAFGNYTRVLLADGATELVLRSLNRWQQALPPGAFLRVHRNAIVNSARVRSIESYGDSDSASLRIDGLDEELAVSRRQIPVLKKLLYAKLS